MARLIRPEQAFRAISGVATATLVLTTMLTPSAHGAATPNQIVGYDALMARLGAGNYPTGAGVVVGHVEAPELSGAFGPLTSLGEFAGKTFTEMSGPAGASGHATQVGQAYYGSVTSIAPGITSIFLYEANSWATTGYLRPGGANPPLATPGGIKIFNNSWVGAAGTENDYLRRADYAGNRDEVLIIDGMPNSAQAGGLMFQAFNSISVGLTSGNHFSTLTSATIDGPGRMKPEITAPSSLTSFATPIVSAAAADLVQTARTVPALMSNPNSQRTEVLKSALLAGALKGSVWSNNPATSGPTRGITATPLDPVYGVGTVNVNLSHLILTGLEQNGSTTVPVATNATFRGWDYNSNLGTVINRYYRFHLTGVASRVSVVAAWNRYVEPDQSFYLMPDFNLQLWKINASNQLVSLVGNGGVGVFGGGNVVSQSAVDNVEHLYITSLQPGDYVLHLSRNDSVVLAWDVAVSWLFPKTGDVNGDGVVNIDDVVAVITAWGNCADPANCPADQNGSGSVNIDDLVLVITNWG